MHAGELAGVVGHVLGRRGALAEDRDADRVERALELGVRLVAGEGEDRCASPGPTSAGGKVAIVVSGAMWSSIVHSQVAPSPSTSRCGVSAVTVKVWVPASGTVPSGPRSCASV